MIITEGKTLQQVSDELAATLIKQVSRCMAMPKNTDIPATEELCAYSDGKGNHCAIGWLLPEDSPAMDYQGGLYELLRNVLSDDHLGPNFQFLEENEEFLELIQNLHDLKFGYQRQSTLDKIEAQFRLDTRSWNRWVVMGEMHAIPTYL